MRDYKKELEDLGLTEEDVQKVLDVIPKIFGESGEKLRHIDALAQLANAIKDLTHEGMYLPEELVDEYNRVAKKVFPVYFSDDVMHETVRIVVELIERIKTEVLFVEKAETQKEED